MPINIRKGNKNDIIQVLRLVNELAVFENAPNEVEVSVDEMIEWGFGKDKQFDFFVADDNDLIVGLAIYYFKYSTWKGKCLFLEDIIVTEAKRGMGIGKLLFSKVLEIAKESSVRRVEWQVLSWNTKAIDFYSKYNAHLDSEWVNCKLVFEQLQNS